MKIKAYIKRSIFIVLAFLIVLLTVCYLAIQIQSKDAKQQAEAVVTSLKDITKLTFEQKYNYTYEIESAMNVNDRVDDFDAIAKRFEKNEEVVFIEFFEDGALKKIYPTDMYENNRIGEDISSFDYANTLSSLIKKTVVEGPTVVNGKDVFLVIKPIYKIDDNGNSVYWGLINVGLDSKTVMEDLNLKNLSKNDYQYELWRVNPIDGSKQIIDVSNKNTNFSKAVEVKFEMPSVWTLSVVPVDGWVNMSTILFMVFATICISLLCGLLVALLWRNYELKQKIKKTALFDQTTQLLNNKGFDVEVSKLIDSNVSSFVMIYVGMDNYSDIYQKASKEQRIELNAHIIECLNSYVKNAEIIGRVGEAYWAILMKEEMSENELSNIKKGLAIELIWKLVKDEEKEFLSARISSVQYPQDGSDVSSLLDVAIQRYYED
ncbi:MAG: GGDEF domain-containing protein [Longicatena sp.]